MVRRVLTIFLAIGFLAACGGETTEPTDTGTAPDTVAETTEPPVAECDYDSALAGKNVNDHVKNIKLKDSDGNKYELHSNCGTKKAIWIILATGW